MIGADGEQLGIMSADKGLRLAREENLDLVNVAPAKPPVCRIMDFANINMNKAKGISRRKRQHSITVKEVKMRPKIENHDFMVKRGIAFVF